MDEYQREIEKKLIKKCQKCMEDFFQRNPGTAFNYFECERCQTGREVHNLERNSKWDSVPFATSKWCK